MEKTRKLVVAVGVCRNEGVSRLPRTSEPDSDEEQSTQQEPPEDLEDEEPLRELEF
jgi:hypothetical protein